MDASRSIQLTLLSREPRWIEAADAAGVERIGIDIERLGKRERQAEALASRISNHELGDLRFITGHARRAMPFVRLNGLHEGTAEEINRAIDLGARCLMLPFFRRPADARRFVELVGGRAEVTLLVETGAALLRLHELTKIPGVSEIMIGMNDLHWDLQLAHPFEIAVSDLLEAAAERVRAAGLGFGLGGVASPDTAGLSLSPDLILARYAGLRVGSSWLARSFFRPGLTPETFAATLAKLRERIGHWFTASPEALDQAREQLREEVRRLSSAGC